MTKGLAAAAVALSLLAPLSAQKFRSAVDAVRADVLVLDREHPVTGLDTDDFELRDNDVVQRIDAVLVEDVPLSAMLALDASQSVAGKPLGHLKQAAAAAIAALRPDDHAALLTFSEQLTLAGNWTADRAALRAAIDRVKASGSTSLNDVAYAALTLRDLQPRRALALIYSDGVDTASWLPPAAVLDIARRSDVVVYGVGLRSAATPAPAQIDLAAGLDLGTPKELAGRPLLPGLAALTGGQMFYADRTQDLETTFVRVINEFKQRYVLVYSPQNVAPDGWHRISVTLRKRQGTVKAREGYWR